ncbi:MAG: flagellar hook-basal body complex protein FliE [Candidatus Margulisbacteria bacterium]|nr:flagellar hook-basal body complex protein FliE [Candidatus Margulisiibacteriota bacterium]
MAIEMLNNIKGKIFENVAVPQGKTPISLETNIFQDTLDKAVDSLNKMSAQEIKAEKLINDYVQGKATLEDVMIEIEKANLSVSLALTVINTSVQTVKEIMQMPI